MVLLLESFFHRQRVEANDFTKYNSVVHTEGWKSIAATEDNTVMCFLPSNSLGKSLDLVVHLEIPWCNGFVIHLDSFLTASNPSTLIKVEAAVGV